jgi:hypothetical protein
MTVAEIVVAFADYQLFFYRNVIYIGLLAGILMKLPEVEKNDEAEASNTQVLEQRNGSEVALQETKPMLFLGKSKQ